MKLWNKARCLCAVFFSLCLVFLSSLNALADEESSSEESTAVSVETTTTEETTTEETTTEESSTSEETTSSTAFPIPPEEMIDVGDVDDDGNPYPYKYSITIEFGEFSFYYDYGIWDVNKLTYQTTSSYPAADLASGAPGWYGFDGLANKISITNESIASEDQLSDIRVTIGFSMEDDYVEEQEHGFVLDATESKIVMTCHGGVTENGVFSFTEPDSVDLTKDDENTYSFVIRHGDQVKKDIYISFSGAPFTAKDTPYYSAYPQQIGFITLTIELASSKASE